MARPKLYKTKGQLRQVRTAYKRQWYAENKEKVNEHKREQRKQGKLKEKKRLPTESCRLSKTNSRLKADYGITLEEKARMLERQDHRCAICGTTLTLKTGYVDHNHRTGKVRGILCNPCNVLLGMATDCKQVLENAILYLDVYEGE